MTISQIPKNVNKKPSAFFGILASFEVEWEDLTRYFCIFKQGRPWVLTFITTTFKFKFKQTFSLQKFQNLLKYQRKVLSFLFTILYCNLDTL